MRRTFKLLGLLALGVAALIVLSFVSIRQRTATTKRTNKEERHVASVGCPVVLTDGAGFRGNHVCLQLGERSLTDFNSSLERVVSYGVRAGYHMHALDERGQTLLYRAGPVEFTRRSRECTKPAFPSGVVAVRVSLAGRSTE